VNKGQEEQQNSRPCLHITREETRHGLRRMKAGKAIGPYSIPMEIWKCLDEEGIDLLTRLFNVIFWIAKML